MTILHVQLAEHEYQTAIRSTARVSRPMRIGLTIASVVVTLFMAVGWWAGHGRQALIGLLTWYAGLAGAWAGRGLEVRLKARQIFRQRTGLHREYDISWSEDGLTIAGARAASTTPWARFRARRETGDLFLLFLSDQECFIVPKRVFPDEASLGQFRDAIANRVPPQPPR